MNSIYTKYTKEALKLLKPRIGSFSKITAIYKIKQQPFFDLPDFTKSDKITIRMPKQYSLTEDKRYDQYTQK